MTDTMPKLDEFEFGLLREGKVIKAIKAYRSRVGCGLAEGKRLADTTQAFIEEGLTWDKYQERAIDRNLFNAAPELLEALKQIVWKVDQTNGYIEMRDDVVIKLARDAIAKAESEVV